MPIRISRMFINNFRLFSNNTIYLGKFLTVIAGNNGTGKSNILGMLGNVCELKRAQRDARSFWTKRSFRTEFAEIFKGDIEHERRNPFCYEVFFDDGDSRRTRISWQNRGTRFRIIPWMLESSSAAKKELPVIYLGLSRLYPFGEADTCNPSSLIDYSDTLNSLGDDEEWLRTKMNRILSIRDDIREANSVRLSDVRKKIGFGVKTPNYGPLTNSAGQDNLGQILSALLAFRKLKNEMQGDFPGGLLLVDEIDATLHPAAQNRLVDLLIEECRELGIQVVITTHSFTLLEGICQRTNHADNRTGLNEGDCRNNIELVYFTKANDDLEIHHNPPLDMVYHDLYVTSSVCSALDMRIKIYSEDDEARWLIEKMLSEDVAISSRVHLIKGISFGFNELVSLHKADPVYFSNILFVFDGDARNQVENLHSNYVFLPGDCRPENLFLTFLKDPPTTEHPFFRSEAARQIGFSRTYFNDTDPLSGVPRRGTEREIMKRWFLEHKSAFDELGLYEFWSSLCRCQVDSFLNEFKRAFNKIADRRMIRRLQ